jgi:hypothetical protein
VGQKQPTALLPLQPFLQPLLSRTRPLPVHLFQSPNHLPAPWRALFQRRSMSASIAVRGPSVPGLPPDFGTAGGVTRD